MEERGHFRRFYGGGIDYLVNNALPLMKGIDDCSYEEFQYALAVSFAGKVRVNAISPGWIDTDYRVYEGADAICIDGGMTKQMIFHDDHGWVYKPGIQTRIPD